MVVEDEADAPLLGRQGGDVRAIELDATGSDRIQSGDRSQQ